MCMFDIGGDKFLFYLLIEEDNLFFGWCGICFILDYFDIFII